jgi:hypothetical protein
MTTEITVNDAGDPEAIVSQGGGDTIDVWEKPLATGWPRKFEAIEGLMTDTPVQYGEAGLHRFQRAGGFDKNQTAGWLQLVAGGGSSTFMVREFYNRGSK